ncbi:MAG: hypothetical protein KAU14_01710 [Thermoplasmata archaeon]|nr:hypothetical protein [Thermoplasmata archaeon]
MGKRVNLQKQNAVISGFVMMKTSMFSFLMLKIVATGTTIGILFAHIITMKDIRGTGRTARNVGRISRQKCMYGTEQTSIISRNLRILLIMSQQSAQSVGKLSNWVKMDIHKQVMNICVKNAEILSYKKFYGNQRPRYIHNVGYFEYDARGVYITKYVVIG